MGSTVVLQRIHQLFERIFMNCLEKNMHTVQTFGVSIFFLNKLILLFSNSIKLIKETKYIYNVTKKIMLFSQKNKVEQHNCF